MGELSIITHGIKHDVNELKNLQIYKEACNSLFRVFGKHEKTLTNSIGYLISQNSKFAKEFLKLLGVTKLNDSQVNQIVVYLQDKSEDGITDIEISLTNKFNCIIEAKINNQFPSNHQILRYLKKLKENDSFPKKIFIVLSDDNDQSKYKLQIFLDSHKSELSDIVLQTISWNDVLLILKSLNSKEPDFLLNELIKFITEDLYMNNYYDFEVWVCPVTNRETIPNTQLTFMDFAIKRNIYFHPSYRNRKKCLYFAPKYNSKIQYFFKILSIEDGKPRDMISELRNIDSIDWIDKSHTFFKLGECIELPKPVKYSGQSHTYCSIEDLFKKNELIKH